MNALSKIVLLIGFLAIMAVTFVSLSKSQQMVVVQSGNHEHKPLSIKLGHFQDSDCGMVIHSLDYASQVVNKEGKTWFFHDHGGMVKWLDSKEFKNDATLWVWAKDTHKWINGRSAWYSRTDITPMNYGFGAYAVKQEGFVSFNEMRTLMMRGENLTNPYVRKQFGMSH
ncbi:MAG: hypothetical protein ACXWB0_02545 [Sulfuricurvum sp.]